MIIFIFFYIPIIIKAWIPTPHLCRVGFLIVLATLISFLIRRYCLVVRVNNRSVPTVYGSSLNHYLRTSYLDFSL